MRGHQLAHPPHHDGLVLKIVPIGPNPKVHIGFEGLYGRSMTAEEIAGGIADATQVDELGNKVTVVAYARPSCPAGTIGGVWKRLNEQGGVFAGRWFNEEGLSTGKLSGIWGRKESGERVMFGIYADADDNFLGLIKGTYAPVGQKGGIYAAYWLNAQGTLGGILVGLYGRRLDASTGEVGPGMFGGRFQAACGLFTPQPPPPADPSAPPTDCVENGTCTDSGEGIVDDCNCTDSNGDGTVDCDCAP
jgi:hypothetical protein